MWGREWEGKWEQEGSGVGREGKWIGREEAGG